MGAAKELRDNDHYHNPSDRPGPLLFPVILPFQKGLQGSKMIPINEITTIWAIGAICMFVLCLVFEGFETTFYHLVACLLWPVVLVLWVMGARWQ
jgi:hypothetical protein